MKKMTLESHFKIIGIGSASGLVYKNHSLFIISDNSSFLYEYHIQEKELSKIKLFENSQENIPKKDKLDFESIVSIGNEIHLLGSGSTPNRNKRISYNLATKKIEEKDWSELYKKLKKIGSLSDDELNIEGVVFYNEKWCFFQRGNGAQSKNGIFILDEEVQFIPILLPKIENIEATFTDAILVKDKIYFLAAAEDTTSTYDDGAILGSLIGCLNADTLAIEFTQKISNTHKFEGLTLYEKTETTIEFFLCEDNDTEVLETVIYKLKLEK